MKWFRLNIRYGARLALLALAMQFGFSFGHFHTGAAQPSAPAIQSVATQSDIPAALAAPEVVERSAQLPAPHDESDQHPSEACVICAVGALAGSALSAPQPSLLPPAATRHLFLITDADFAHLAPVGGAFQPRAPPCLLTSMT